jgi:hypothetical protein
MLLLSVLSLGAWREAVMGKEGEFAGGGKFLVPAFSPLCCLFVEAGGGFMRI